MSKPHPAKLQFFFAYDKATGVVTRRVARGACKVGDVAGHCDRDKMRLRIDGQDIPLTQVIWAIVTGEWPPQEVDHADRDWRNNRWDNLRLATRVQNMANVLQPIRPCGLPKGIDLNPRGRFIARAARKHIGTFDSLREARIVQGLELLESHGHFACFDDRFLVPHAVSP